MVSHRPSSPEERTPFAVVADLRLRIFPLGSFRDLRPDTPRARAVLERLRTGLRALGWDAFISGDTRSVELAGPGLRPRAMTEILEPLTDLAIYVATLEGRGDGWVSELTAMQILNPRGKQERVLLAEEAYPLSSILDPAPGGYLADPPMMVIRWKDEQQLLAEANRLATVLAKRGELR